MGAPKSKLNVGGSEEYLKRRVKKGKRKNSDFKEEWEMKRYIEAEKARRGSKEGLLVDQILRTRKSRKKGR
jgi:hypothetical protein